MKTLRINNQSLSIEENILLEEALKLSGIKSFQGIAVAVNNQVIPKNKWNEYQLNNNDSITVIRAAQGG